MSNVGCRIIKDFDRPDRELVEAFRGLPVANIDDGMNRTGAIDGAIRPMNKTPLLGTAFTVRVPEGDNLMFHKAMDLAKPGDVIVIDAGGNTKRAIFGEIMTTYCQSRGIAGLIVDGAIRDADALENMNFPVYARAKTPNGPYKNGPGEINVPVNIGGRIVCPGDIILGDYDGVIVIKPENAKELAEKAKAVEVKEAKIMETMQKDGSYSRPWVDELIASLGFDIIEKL